MARASSTSKPKKPRRPQRREVERMESVGLGELKATESLDPELVSTQVAVASAQAKIWQAREMLCLLDGDTKQAIYASREAREWETQKTRAIKSSLADRITDLERRGKQQSTLRAKIHEAKGLQVVSGGVG